MTIRKKSKEELQAQAEGFLDYASERGKITEKQKKKISKTLGISELDEKGFFERLSKKFGKEIDILDELEIKKVLKKKKINVEKLWDEYLKYVKVVKFVEPYKDIHPEFNDDIIKYILESENTDLKKIKLFLSSQMYENCINFYVGNLDYLLNELGNTLENEDFTDLLKLGSFKDVGAFEVNQENVNILNVKVLLLVLKNPEIFSRRNYDFLLLYITETKIDNDIYNRIISNIDLYKNNKVLGNHIKDYRDFFLKDFSEIINSEKEIIMNQNSIWYNFHSGKDSLSEEQKKYLESIFDGYTFDLSDKEKAEELFKLPETEKEPTIVDRLKAFNDMPNFSPLGDDLPPIVLFPGDEADYFDEQRILEITGMPIYALSEEQKQFLESIFDGYTFDLTQENEEQLMQLFPPKEIIQETDIITRLENFNIIKTEIPDLTNDDFERHGVYSHLLNDLDSEKLRNYLKSLKELGFNEKDDLLAMLTYGSNRYYGTNSDCYLDDVLEITKLYMDTLDMSATECLEIYKTLFYYDHDHIDSLEPIFDNESREYIEYYKDRDKILTLKKLGLSNKAVIACLFTSIELFKTLLELGMPIDEINKIFEEDPAYSYDYWDAPKFSIFIQYLLRSNKYGIHRWKGDEQKEIDTLKSLLKEGKQKYIIPLLRIIGDEFDKSIGFDGVDRIQKYFEKIDVITDKIAIEDFIEFFKGCNLHVNNIDHFIETLDIIVKNLDDINIEKLELFKDLAKNLYIKPKNLELVFEKFPQLVNNAEATLENINALESILRSEYFPENFNVLYEKFPQLVNNAEATLENINALESILRSEYFPENFNVLYEKFPISITELVQLKEVLALQSFAKNFKIIFETFSPFEIEDFKNYGKVFSFTGEFPEDLQFKENNPKGYLTFICDIVATYYNDDKKSKMIKKIVSLSFEQAENYLKIFKMLDESISMDIQRVKNELIDEILDCENPEKIVETIINIFERNNLPLTGKIFKVFELLYPKEKIESTLQPHGSPILHKYLDKGKNVYALIYADLMNIAIKSGDRSLKNYINTFIGSEKLLKKFESIIDYPGFNPNDKLCLDGKLEEREQEQLLYLFRKCSVLYNRYYGKDIEEGDTIEDKTLGTSNISDDQLVKFYNDIKEGFHLKKGESIYDRLQRFLLGLGYHSFEEVLDKMNESKKQAHERGLKLYNESNGGKINFPQHAFLKGVDENAFSQIINRGLTCREYLGGGENGNAAGSDCTPFDVDGWYTDSFVDRGYGKVKIVIDTKKESIYDSREKGVEGYENEKYELFKTGHLSEEHYGIRTGIPSTEVDYVIYTGNFESREFQTICYDIARNGYYIPITDSNGNIKYTPEMYHKIRAGFNYMEYYDGFDVQKINGKYELKTSDNEIYRENSGKELQALISDNSPQNEKYKSFAKENRELAESTIKWIKQILEEKCGIKFNSKYDSSITGAELHDSGSTGRGTDIPTKDVDLDFTLILDAKDYERVAEISKVIHEEIGTQKNDDHGVMEGGNQIKSKINNIGKSEERPNGVPLDLLILKKSQVIDYSSSDAMKEKLEYIANNPKSGTEDLDRVRTNVIIMKKLLKAKGCYKKPEGGISGIGVENWITQNHGSFIEALESFEEVAYGGKYEEGKQPLPLKDFQEGYPIYDAGENYKDGCNDNFVYKLKENGYKGTLEIVQVLRLEGIKGIMRLIKEYEKKKKEYTG